MCQLYKCCSVEGVVDAMRDKKKKVLVLVIILLIGIVAVECLVINFRSKTDDAQIVNADESGNEETESEIPEQETEIKVSPDLSEYYITNTGDPSNLYYIDENQTLWGCGQNNYGQLGQTTQDYEFHDEKVKIAENVIHTDFSQKGFTIFLTADHKLYGMGNAGTGALQQYDDFDWDRYVNGEHYYLDEPTLLMEDVAYARCGKDDIVCLTENGEVWTWGTITIMGGYMSSDVWYISSPEKILDNAVFVTGGWFNHAALLSDGTVWTWGYNQAGNCGIEEPSVIKEPTMVAENVAMVWTGSLQYNSECIDIAEFDGVYPDFMNNTVIQKIDGTYWICGENVGTEEKVVHGAEADYTVVCSHEFVPYKGEIAEIRKIQTENDETNDEEFDQPLAFVENEIYRNALEKLQKEHITPNGEQFVGPENFQFNFCIIDIDSDGKDEMLINNPGTCTADMETAVYGIEDRTNELFCKASVFPMCEFYDNGILVANWSHNHYRPEPEGFWPYDMLKYNNDAKQYLEIAKVGGWKCYSDDNEYPKEQDKDKDGELFLILNDDYSISRYMDKAEYEEWYNEQIGSASMINIKWIPLVLESNMEPVG